MRTLCKNRMRSSASKRQSRSRHESQTDLPRYDFEYEEDDDDDSSDVDIENKYYNAKQLKQTDPEDAIGEFLGIPPIEKEKGEWGFKGLKQAIKLEFKLGQYGKVRFSPAVEYDGLNSNSTSRQPNIMRSSSHSSSPPLRETTRKSQ